MDKLQQVLSLISRFESGAFQNPNEAETLLGQVNRSGTLFTFVVHIGSTLLSHEAGM
jgi:hypothetical protein